MPSSRNALLVIALLAAVAPAALTRSAPGIQPYDRLADSLYEAAAYDSLVHFSTQQIEDATTHGDSVRLGRMLVYRGRARLWLRQPEARRDFDRGLAVASAARDSLGWASALGFQALLRVIDGRWDESIRINEQRIAMGRAIRSAGNLGWGHTLIGYACLMQGKLERAEREYRSAVAVFRSANRPREALEALIGLGRVHNSAGRVTEARAAYHEALAIAQQLEDRRQEGDCWNNLGGLELERGDLSLAAAYFRRAYDLKREQGAWDISSPAGNVALANTLIGRYAAAESVLVDAIQSAQEWNYHVGFADLYVTLGYLRMAQDRPRGATVYFRRAVERGDTATVEARHDALAGLALALAEQDSSDAALRVLEAKAAGAMAAPPSSARSELLIVWSRCLRAVGEPARAKPLAAASFGDATSRDDAAAAVLAALESSAVERALGDDAAAFAWFDRARALFAASSARSGEYQWREAFRASLAPPLVAGAEVMLAWPPAAPREERERALFDCLQEVRARTLMERVTDPRRTDDGVSVAAMVTARQLQRDVLRPGECLLDISTAVEDVFVFALTRDSLRLAIVRDADGALEQQGRRYAGLASAPGGGVIPPASTPAALLQGVADILAAATSVIVVADGWVASLPFAALSLDGASLLADRHEISTVPAASLLLDLRARPAAAPAAGVLAFAPAGGSLPGARREVRTLASRYQDVHPVETLAAGVTFADLVRGRGIVHVATHVHVNGERPWHSGIQLGPDSARADYLRASEIIGTDFRDRLVVLSSCESALGRATQGEGILGITTAFLGAGARAVVATLWKVDDRTTSELMIHFYEGLAHGMTAGEALRDAQLRIRQRRPAPFYWAGFVVVGDAGAHAGLDARPRSRILMVLFMLGALTLAGAALAGFRRRRPAPV